MENNIVTLPGYNMFVKKAKKIIIATKATEGMYSKVNVVKFTLTEMGNCEQWHNVPHMHLITMAQCGRCPLHM